MSGGIDSSSATSLYVKAGNAVSGLFIDYGQLAAQSEWDAAQRIAAHYDIELDRIELGFKLPSSRGEFFGRNAMFILIASGFSDRNSLDVAIGIHALSEYYDTTLLFVQHMQRILDGYSAGRVSLKTPFLSNTKSEVIQVATENAVPISLTYSCERQNFPP